MLEFSRRGLYVDLRVFFRSPSSVHGSLPLLSTFSPLLAMLAKRDTVLVKAMARCSDYVYFVPLYNF